MDWRWFSQNWSCSSHKSLTIWASISIVCWLDRLVYLDWYWDKVDRHCLLRNPCNMAEGPSCSWAVTQRGDVGIKGSDGSWRDRSTRDTNECDNVGGKSLAVKYVVRDWQSCDRNFVDCGLEHCNRWRKDSSCSQ